MPEKNNLKVDFEILKKYSRKNKKREYRAIYDNSQEWNMYATRICRTSKVRNELKKRQNKICPICSEHLGTTGTNIHHTDYAHRCQRQEMFKEDNLYYPQCSACFKETPDFFENCTSKLVLVHHECHKKLHGRDFLEDWNAPDAFQ